MSAGSESYWHPGAVSQEDESKAWAARGPRSLVEKTNPESKLANGPQLIDAEIS